MSLAVSFVSLSKSFPSVRRSLSCRRRHLRHRLEAAPVETGSYFGDESFEPEDNIASPEFYQQFNDLLGAKSWGVEPGQQIEGTVFAVEDSGVFVDYGGKEIGFCASSDLALTKVSKPRDLISVNSRRMFEVVEIGVKKKRLGGEITILSRQNLIKEVLLERLKLMNQFQVKFPVEVVEKNRGGYVVSGDSGVSMFLPGRHSTTNPGLSTLEDDPLIGQTIIVRILDVIEDDFKLIVSQRGTYMSPELEAQLVVGNVVEGIVETITPFGVFINFDGMAGLLHSTQISWSPIDDIGKYFKVREPIKAMVFTYDKLRGRLSVTTKKLEAEPGDMLRDKQKVYDGAEKMAAKFREDLASAEARSSDTDIMAATPDISIRPR